MALVRKNPSSGGEFARLWAQLPPAQQRAMIQQVRSALRQVPQAAADGLTHPPMGTNDRPIEHSHPHHFSGDRVHSHLHQHSGDALHVGHSHEDLEQAQRGAEQVKRSASARIMNTARRMSPAQEQRIDAAWSRLAAGVQQTGQEGRR
jgi:hypothetical protein